MKTMWRIAWALVLFCLSGSGCTQEVATGDPGDDLDEGTASGETVRVTVRAVFLVPRDAVPPSEETVTLLSTHLLWARARFRELLSDMDTFALASETPLVLDGVWDGAAYAASTDYGADMALQELFSHDRVDRLSCPYVYLVLFVGTGSWPPGGGRPINGGLNTGGGIVVLSAGSLTASANFQSTLQHELGHGFGLVHVDAYGYDMETNESIMSYNRAHHTNGLAPSATPGRLIPEDLRALSYVKRVFPAFVLDPGRDYPPGYPLGRILILLVPMHITGQAEYTGPSIVESAP